MVKPQIPHTPCMPYMPTLGWFWGVNGAAFMAYMERLGMVRSPALTLLLRLHGSQWNPTQKTSAEEPPRRHRPVRERGHLRPPSEGGCAVFVSSEGGIGDVGDGVRFKQPLRERHHILILSMHPRIMAVDVFQDCHHSSFYRHPHHEL